MGAVVGGPDLPGQWLFESLKRLEDRIAGHGAEMRVSFRELQGRLDGMVRTDNELELRIAQIETAMRDHDLNMARRTRLFGALAGALSGSGAAAAFRWFARHLGQ